MADRGSSVSLRLCPGTQARQLLIETLDAFERGEQSNLDRLVLLGARLAHIGHRGLDVAAVDWSGQRPSRHRLGIVSNLLCGLWKHGVEGTHVAASAIEGLARLHPLTRGNEALDYQVLLALAARASGIALPDVVRDILNAALEKPLSNPELDRILKDVIGRVMGADHRSR